MYHLRKYFFLILLLMAAICFGQDRKVELEIIGAKTYNDLFIRSFQLNNNPFEFAGKKINATQWTFTIPDSIVKKSLYFELKSRTPTENRIGFLGVIQGDTLIGHYINFENEEVLIRLKIEYHHTNHEVNSQYIPSLKKTITIQQWDTDYFSIDPNLNNYLIESMIDPSFGFEGYNDMQAKIKKNPNSLYYLTRLAMTTHYNKSKEDIAQLYYLFSNKMQHSYYGQIIYNNFSTFKIANVSLINCDTKMEEKIVEDPDKYTLLIFSASWCAPCRKKIPILKKIHKEMSKVLNMVYITIDDEKMLSQWEKLMHKENIPWRSLSLNNNKELQDSWDIGAIPDYILINPDWEARKINLSDENDINTLHSIIQKN